MLQLVIGFLLGLCAWQVFEICRLEYRKARIQRLLDTDPFLNDNIVEASGNVRVWPHERDPHGCHVSMLEHDRELFDDDPHGCHETAADHDEDPFKAKYSAYKDRFQALSTTPVDDDPFAR